MMTDKGNAMSPLPTVSVILPTYNRATFIAEAIGSVLAQSSAPHQILIVDDGSTDATAETVARFGDAVTYLHQPNAGKLAAIETGLDHATGALVWVMDDDDIAPPDAIRDLATPFADAPQVVMSYGRMTHFSGQGATLRETPVAYPRDDRPFFIRLMESCFISGHPCVMVRRAALEKLRPFDRKIIASVDYYLHLNVAMQGGVVAVDSIVLRQRQHDGLRGPLAHRYRESDRFGKWIHHDAYLFDGLLDRLPLAAFLGDPPWHDGPLPPATERRALIQRAAIAGRKKLWPRALADLRNALAILPETPLDRAERKALSAMLGCPYGIDEVFEDRTILSALRASALTRPDSADILATLARPLLTELKKGRQKTRTLGAWLRLMDIPATARALHASARRNLARALNS